METKLYEKPSGRRNAKSDIFGSSQPHVFGLLLDPLMPVLAEMMLGVHVQDKRRILFYKPYQKTFSDAWDLFILSLYPLQLKVPIWYCCLDYRHRSLICYISLWARVVVKRKAPVHLM